MLDKLIFAQLVKVLPFSIEHEVNGCIESYRYWSLSRTTWIKFTSIRYILPWLFRWMNCKKVEPWNITLLSVHSCHSTVKLQDLGVRDQLKCDGTHTWTRFRVSAKRTSSFKSAGASVQSTTGSRGVRISGSNAGYTMFWVSVKGTGYPLHSPVSPSLPLPTSPCAITFQLESTPRGVFRTVTLTNCAQAGKSLLQSPMVSLEFFIDLTLPTALWP
jgi:hypothetical protein